MAKDKYHNQVKEALINEGWSITADPYYIVTPFLNYPVDLGAEKIFSANKNNQKIAVEVKCFLGDSLPNEFHTALGQYLDYEAGMEEQEPDRKVYLAIPLKAWQQIQKIPLLMKVLDKYNVNLIIYEPISKTIITWITR